MRIRRSAARLLGSASYSAPAAAAPDATAPFELLTTPPPPQQFLVPCSATPESRAGGGFASPPTASGEPCELSRSPWDLIAELSISDPQVEDDLVDKYFVSVTCRASWLFSASMPAASVKKEKLAVGAVDEDSATQPRHEAPKKLAVSKKAALRENEPKKKPKVKKMEDEERKPPVYKCKKNDGKRWHCSRVVSSPNSLCDYHFYQKRAYLNPDFAAVAAAEAEAEPEPEHEKEVPPLVTASKPATSSKPRKKKPGHDSAATEGFYYYAGFGPFRSKRQCRSSGMNEPVPPKQETEEDEPAEDGSPTNQQAQAAADDTNKVAAQVDASSCNDIAGIAGGDEESSEDDYGLGISGRNVNGEHRTSNGDGKRKNGWKRWRKPVKARSLKSLM